MIDAAMTDGSSLTYDDDVLHAPIWILELRKTDKSYLDGAAHFYDTYECADGKYVSIGSIEPQFYALLCENAGLAQDLNLENR